MPESDAGRDRVDGADVEAEKLCEGAAPGLPGGRFLISPVLMSLGRSSMVERWSPTPMGEGSIPSVPAKPCLRAIRLVSCQFHSGNVGAAWGPHAWTSASPGPHSRATLAHQEERPTRNGQVTRSTRVGGSQGSGTDPASDGGAKDNAWRSPSRPPIYVDVAQFGRARRRHRRGRRFDPGHPLQALVAQLADAHGLDPWLSSMRVRIPPSARDDPATPPAPDWTGTGLLIRTAGVRVLWAARQWPCGAAAR